MIMGLKPTPHCAFAEVILHYTDFVSYEIVMEEFPAMLDGLSKESYRKYKREMRRRLNSGKNYFSQAGKAEFLSHFDLKTWRALSNGEKAQHSYRECQSCRLNTHKDIYTQYRRNASGNDQIICGITCSKLTAEGCAKAVLAKIEPVFQWKFGKSFKETILNIFNEAQTNIIKTEVESIGNGTAEDGATADLSHNVSYTAMSNLRRDITLDANKEPRSHVYQIMHDNYGFDRDAVRTYLSQKASTVNWTVLAQHYPVTHHNGQLATNAPEILKEFAVDIGAVKASTVPRKRRRMRAACVNGMEVSFGKLLPTEGKLNRIAEEKISTGSIDVGPSIAPKWRYSSVGDDGQLSTEEVVLLHSRVLKVEKIMDDTLNAHYEAGMLHPMYPEDCEIVEALQDWSSKESFEVREISGESEAEEEAIRDSFQVKEMPCDEDTDDEYIEDRVVKDEGENGNETEDYPDDSLADSYSRAQSSTSGVHTDDQQPYPGQTKLSVSHL